MNPDIRRGDPSFKHLDPAGKAVNGVITDRADGLTGLGEITVVDRGSNYGTKFSLCKATAAGVMEWTGEMTAPEDVLAKAAVPAKSKTVTVELPKNVSVSFSPKDLAKLVEHRHQAEQREAVKAAEPVMVTKAAAEDDEDDDLGKIALAESVVYKRDIDTATRRRLAGEGKALPNLSYPIETAEDLGNAATLARSGHGNVAAARKLIARRAKELGVKNPLKRGDKVKKVALKAAEPEVTKCMKCDDSGMMDGKPCPDCKKGKKAAKKAAAAEKAKVRKALAEPAAVKKKKVMCPNCGAKQNVKHVHCPECGKPLPRMAPAVVKNHDFACLGCGKDPLDKGEPHCPDCGKENPGYLPEADHKIPANKVAAKESVSKKRKAKGSKGDNPFGDKKAPPFGAKDDEDEKPAAKKVTKRKGKGKGRSPAAGVAGHDGDTKPLPAHREPDSPAVEEFEKSSNLEDGDQGQEMAAAMRHKSLSALGLSREDAVLHDLTCPAFSPEAVSKAFPFAAFDAIDTGLWQMKALEDASSAPLEKAASAQMLWQHACTLKGADAEVLHDLRVEAYKAFRDANPGPGSFPTPGHVTPQQFQRPYIGAGHGAESPQHEAPHSFGVPSGQPSAEQYTRGLITEGHAADSPDNDTPRHEPQPASMEPGRPERVYYRGTMKDNARQAMTAMHDHISRVFPDVCPMSPELGGTQKPAPAVPEGVGGNAPVSRKAAKAKAKKAAKKMAAKRRRLERKVLAGKMTVKAARKELGMKPPKRAKAKTAAPSVTKAAAVTTPALDAEAITEAITKANAPLLERIAAQDKTLRKQRKAIDAIASQPDTSQAPLRGVAAVNKTSAPPAGALSVAKSAELAKGAQLALLQDQWRNSPDPGTREAAYQGILEQLELTPMHQTKT